MPSKSNLSCLLSFSNGRKDMHTVFPCAIPAHFFFLLCAVLVIVLIDFSSFVGKASTSHFGNKVQSVEDVVLSRN